VSSELRVGCPMWAHPPWVGRYLSPARRGEELAEYATWCNAVEGNTTFYAVPSTSTVRRWADQAPPGFRFAFKVPRTVTHEQRLRHAAHREVAALLRALEPLGERVGPVQIQLPPSFGPDALPVLRDFVTRLPLSHQWMVELRHPAFFDGGIAHRELDAVLADADVGRVVLDARPLHASPARSDAAAAERSNKPLLPIATEAVGPTPIVRVITGDDPAEGLAGLLAWAPTIVDWIAVGRTPHVFAHQPDNRDSPTLARRLHDVVRRQVPDLTALPDPGPVTDRGELPGQETLF
jgi:uncharacterized protein YecE (DUF72 family)